MPKPPSSTMFFSILYLLLLSFLHANSVELIAQAPKQAAEYDRDDDNYVLSPQYYFLVSPSPAPAPQQGAQDLASPITPSPPPPARPVNVTKDLASLERPSPAPPVNFTKDLPSLEASSPPPPPRENITKDLASVERPPPPPPPENVIEEFPSLEQPSPPLTPPDNVIEDFPSLEQPSPPLTPPDNVMEDDYSPVQVPAVPPVPLVTQLSDPEPYTASTEVDEIVAEEDQGYAAAVKKKSAGGVALGVVAGFCLVGLGGFVCLKRREKRRTKYYENLAKKDYYTP